MTKLLQSRSGSTPMAVRPGGQRMSNSQIQEAKPPPPRLSHPQISDKPPPLPPRPANGDYRAGASSPPTVEKNPVVERMDSESDGGKGRSSANDCMWMFLRVLRICCDFGEVRLEQEPFREVARLLGVVVERAEALSKSHRLSDVYSSAEDDTTTTTTFTTAAPPTVTVNNEDLAENVCSCWSCGELNRSPYIACVSCKVSCVSLSLLSQRCCRSRLWAIRLKTLLLGFLPRMKKRSSSIC